MIVWGGLPGYTDAGGQYDPEGNSWTATETIGAPSGRAGHTAVWSGSKMIVWGGYDSGLFNLNTGGRYDPSLGGPGGSWTSTNIAGAPTARQGHTAVWTGSRMIVWGGTGDSSGGQYDPGTDTWTPTTETTGVPPSRRSGHTAVWTGSRMIIWGGSDGTFLNDGAQYNPGSGPGTDSWTPTAMTPGVPSGRANHSAVWTGTRMIVWGGTAATGNTGGQYDPVSDTWRSTATTAGVPRARFNHTSVWTGSRMIVWGGFDAGTRLNTGGQWFTLSYFVKN
jgi:N-acetylneuraminic acid mutarotase